MTDKITNDLSLNIVPCPDEDLELAYEHFNSHFENFVFEGGGIRGIAFGGTIYYLEKHDLMKHIKRFAGSSAGSIVAAALSVGYSGKEIINILHNTNFKQFEDDSWGVVGDLYRIFTKFGVYKGEAFEEWFQTVLAKKTGNPDITFLEIYEKYGKELAITGTCLNTAETHYYHYTTYPHMPIKKAVRISMSIPVFFASVKEGNTIMVDGGLLNNYPIWVFDGDTIGDSHVSDEQIVKSKTIGFKLMTDQEKQDYKLYHVDEKINNIFQYAKALINTLLIQIERGHIRSGYWKKTVAINTHNVSSLEFSLPEETKQKLIQTGYDSIHEKLVAIQREQLQLNQESLNVLSK
jgi:NTE family protein